ncbi:MAG TPA: hypothetical protein VIL74_07195 [Pyrinomonadaceae bacterium]
MTNKLRILIAEDRETVPEGFKLIANRSRTWKSSAMRATVAPPWSWRGSRSRTSF